MAQLIRITSEALQQTIRRLLPSQQGFGEDLQASNVITPIIDLTPTAEGSVLREDLQTARDETVTSVNITNSKQTLISATGFIRCDVDFVSENSSFQPIRFYLNDGLASQLIYQAHAAPTNSIQIDDLRFFVPSGSTLEAETFAADVAARVFSRQVADIYGNLIDPAGFTEQ